MAEINLLIADDHMLFRRGMMALLGNVSEVGSIYEAANGKEAVELVKLHEPDVVLMDINMPIMDGIAASKLIIDNYPNTKVLILSMNDGDNYINHMVDMGVHGYLFKDAEPIEIERAVIAVYEKGFYYNDTTAKSLKSLLDGRNTVIKNKLSLSDREEAVLKLICLEYTNKEMASHLNISQRTIEKIRAHLLEKTGAKNTAGLVKFAISSNLT